MKSSVLTPAEKFFYQHAGYSRKPHESEDAGKRRCAKAMAKAEARAQRVGIHFEWNDDDERAYCYCDDPTCKYHEGSDADWETLYCVAYKDCHCRNAAHQPHRDIVGSLSGIMDPDASYRRVVEAELASEYFAEVRRGNRRISPKAADAVA